ncbi:MAG: thioredoxin domain-containing protein [Saprospiraceae bacterium]
MENFDFNRDVVELSFKKYVLLDFWADWCGPCKILGPILEELELEYKGKWSLVKIDTEQHQEIAAHFQIQSIPNCKLVFEGKIVDEFSGVQTKEATKQWLDKYLSEFKLEEVEEIEAEPDDFEEIMAGQENIPDKKFVKILESYVKAHPENEAAQISLLKHQVFFQPGASLQALKNFSNPMIIEEFELHFKVIQEFVQNEFDDTSIASNFLSEAKKFLLQGDGQNAIDYIIKSLHQDSKYSNEIARRFGITLFKIWGYQSALTKENRKLFDMAIW